jgi:hypothetical protein
MKAPPSPPTSPDGKSVAIVPELLFSNKILIVVNNVANQTQCLTRIIQELQGFVPAGL